MMVDFEKHHNIQWEEIKKMIDEKVCLQNMHRIISECSHDPNIKKISLNELQPIYQEIADHIFRISVSNTKQFKNMLWNLDNLKPGIRSTFQKDLFDKWSSAYQHSNKIDGPTDHPDKEKQDLIVLSQDQVSEEIPTKDSTPATERSDKTQEQKPVQNGPELTGSILTGHVYKTDWFDKLLDASASIMGYFSGLMGR
jgi:hypothetical protein